MLYYLYTILIHKFSILNILKYITFRSLACCITAFVIVIFTMPSFIDFLKRKMKAGQPIRSDGPESHFSKKGTPTMGGGLIILAMFVSLLIWGNISNQPLLLTMFVTASYAILGMVDDYKKVAKQNTGGVSGKQKLLIQLIVSIISFYWMDSFINKDYFTVLSFPLFKNLTVDIGIFYLVFIAVVTVGSSNAVNLTDGLDGLVTVPLIIAAFCFGIISYLVGHSYFAVYLNLINIPGTGELAVFCAAMIGALLGFLWYNCAPAQIFMGDTGSLALGGALGIISVLTKHEIVLAIVGGIFVIEAISVILQVYYFKISKGRRIFLMAPIHHHFEKKGWPEVKVVVRFWIVSVIFALIGIATLKIR